MHAFQLPPLENSMDGDFLTFPGAAYRHRYTSAAIATDARINPEWQPVVEERLLGLGKIHGIEDFLSGWFHGAPFESLK